MTSKEELAALRTEQVDEKFALLDVMTVGELLQVMNESDTEVPKAVALVLPTIKVVIDGIIDRMLQGGRLIYLGAGTSGRLGVLDAAELGPTFSVAPTEVIAFIAGGEVALRQAVEAAEDNEEASILELKRISASSKDVILGIAASGRTPYVISALKYGNEIGALTVGLTSNPGSEITKVATHAIAVDTGPELLAARTAREIRDRDHANEIKATLEKSEVLVTVKVGSTGSMFGSVTDKDIVAAIKSTTGVDIDRHRIKAVGHIKKLGSHAIKVSLHSAVTANVTISVVAA